MASRYPDEETVSDSSSDDQLMESEEEDWNQWIEGTYFCHVTLHDNKESIKEIGLMASKSHSEQYDGFLFYIRSLKGIWWTVKNAPPMVSCYPFCNDTSKIEDYNPMIYVHYEKIPNLAHQQWYLVDYKPKNVKIVCVPDSLTGFVPKYFRNERIRPLNKHSNDFFRLGPDGNYLIPNDESSYLSVFTVLDEYYFKPTEAKWKLVKKI